MQVKGIPGENSSLLGPNEKNKMPPLPSVPQRGALGMPMGMRVPMSRQQDIVKKDQIKYSDYMKLEKMRKFKRLPRLIG